MKKYQKSLPVIAAIILVVTIAAVWFGVQHSRGASQTAKSSMYDTFEARRMDLSEKVDATGSVITEKNASMYPPYSTIVKEIRVRPGDTVRKGDTLLVLQLKDADLINYAASWKSSLDQAHNNLIVAQRALGRQQTLYQVQGTTIDELESAQKTVQEYQAQIEEYKLKLDSLTKNGVDDQNNVIIRAPYDSEVSWINIKLEQSVSPTDELLTLGGASAIRIQADVDQGDISQIQEGQRASITANDENRTIVPGIVTSFGSTGTTNSSVVTFPVDIKPLGSGDLGNNLGNTQRVAHFRKPSPSQNLDNSGTLKPRRSRPGQDSTKNKPNQNLSKLLKSGMTVDVTIMVNSHKDVLAVPLRAITQVNGVSVVKVLKQGKLISQKVSLGFQSDKFVEILSGLTEGETVTVPKTQFFNNPNSTRNNNSRGGIRMGGGMAGPPPM